MGLAQTATRRVDRGAEAEISNSTSARRPNRSVGIKRKKNRMKIDKFASARTTFTTFENIGDSYTLTLTEEPALVVDPLNEDRQMVTFIGVDDSGKPWQINGRTQLPEAVAEAVNAAGVDEIVAGGRLTVTFVDTRGRMKVYDAQYKPPVTKAAQ